MNKYCDFTNFFEDVEDIEDIENEKNYFFTIKLLVKTKISNNYDIECTVRESLELYDENLYLELINIDSHDEEHDIYEFKTNNEFYIDQIKKIDFKGIKVV